MSGWSYSDWQGIFYPEGFKSTDFLQFYSKYYDCAEVNSSFYHLPRATTTQGWVEKTPKGFMFCPKMSKYLTHIKRLHEPEEPLQKFFKVFEPIKKHLGPVLIQLPPSLKFDADLVTAFFDALKNDYSDYSFALEGRHKTWIEQDAIALLRKYGIAWVISQSGVGYPYLEEVTSSNVYIRFHGPGKLYSSSYSDDMLRDYALKIKKWVKDEHQIWVFFNNTMGGVALRNADTLMKMISAK